MNPIHQSFSHLYKKFCIKHGICPAKSSKLSVNDGILDINAERLKSEDWSPLLEALQESSDLKFIAVRCKYEAQNLYSLNGRTHNGAAAPYILEAQTRRKLCESLKWCLKLSSMLECLIIENIPLKLENTIALRDGLLVNQSIQLLSLEKCLLGDKGFNEICMGIKNSSQLTSVNFSDCNLTWKCVKSLAAVIQCQDGLHHEETWKKSFRFQLPHLNEIEGLREVILSHNPGIGDQGVCELAKLLSEDLWIQVLDVQHCGFTDEGGQALYVMVNNKPLKMCIFLENNPIQDENLIEKFRNYTNSVNSSRQVSSRSATSKASLTRSWLYKMDERMLRDPKRMYRKGNGNGRNSDTDIKVVKENESLKNQLQKCMVLLEKEKAKCEELESRIYELTLENEKLKYLQNTSTKIDMDEKVFNQIESTFKNFYNFLSYLKDVRLNGVQTSAENERGIDPNVPTEIYDGYQSSSDRLNQRNHILQEWEKLSKSHVSQMRHVHIIPENYNLPVASKRNMTTDTSDIARDEIEFDKPEATNLKKGFLLPTSKQDIVSSLHNVNAETHVETEKRNAFFQKVINRLPKEISQNSSDADIQSPSRTSESQYSAFISNDDF